MADVLFKQHLKLSPNAQFKNLVFEKLDKEPPKEEWRAGRVWFNTSIGKFQGIFYKLDPKTGLPVEPKELELRILGADELGYPSDGEFYPDGLFEFTATTKIVNAIDDINEALKDLAPSDASPLFGELEIFNQKQKGLLSDISELNIEHGDIEFGDEINYIILENNIKGKTKELGKEIKGEIQKQFNKADKGILNIYVDNEKLDNGINLEELFYEPSREFDLAFQGYDYPVIQNVYNHYGEKVSEKINPNKDKFINETKTLIVNKIEKYNNFKMWQRGIASFNLNLNDGFHEIKITHENIPTPQETLPTKIFIETNSNEIKLNKSDILINGDTKYLSGIPYYNNLKINFDISISNLFDYTYWLIPVKLEIENIDTTDIIWNDENTNLNNKDFPKYNDDFNYNNEISYFKENYTNEILNINLLAGKPKTKDYINLYNFNKKILINTYGNNSNNLEEYFTDETYRKPLNINFDNIDEIKNTNWDSSKELSENDALIYMNKLTGAKKDFTEFNIDIKYDFKPPYYYIRYIIGDKANNNGIIEIKTNNILNNDFNIYFKLPGVTGWLDLSKLYDYEYFKNNYTKDGTGNATNIKKTNDGYQISWTVGDLSTIDSDYMYLIKLELLNENSIIYELKEISPNWRN